MVSELEGGCRVTALREGPPDRVGTIRVWSHVGRAVGARAISMRVLEFEHGISTAFRNESCDEVLYVLEGNGTLFLDGHPQEISPDTGIFLPPKTWLAAENPGPGPLVMVSSPCPEPEAPEQLGPAPTGTTPGPEQPPRRLTTRLSDREACPTGDRWYRMMVDAQMGSKQVTQFVGSIPPGRAPDHYHHYEEVLCVLRGEGTMWAGETSAPIAPGSCIFLPRRQLHCVENTGDGELRLLGVFYPAGSPAVRYGED